MNAHPFNAVEAAVAQVGTGLLRAFIPAGKAIMQLGQGLHDIAKQAYQNAGQPYGGTPEGMLRWLDEAFDSRQQDTPTPAITPEHK